MRCCIIPIAAHRATRSMRNNFLYCFKFFDPTRFPASEGTFRFSTPRPTALACYSPIAREPRSRDAKRNALKPAHS